MKNQGFYSEMNPELNSEGRWVFPNCEGTVFWFASFRSMASALGARATYFLAIEKSQMDIIQQISDELEKGQHDTKGLWRGYRNSTIELGKVKAST